MSKPLTLDDIDEKIRNKVYCQNYSKKPVIEGVKIVEMKNFVGEDGDLSELLKLNENGESFEFSGFKLKQINRSVMLPNTIKAWHLHFKQDEIWFVPSEVRLLVGLWDVRKISPSKNINMRIILGNNKTQLLFIPKGVAHGSANTLNINVPVIYFIDHLFDIKNPDEKRMPWDSLSKEFWKLQRD